MEDLILENRYLTEKVKRQTQEVQAHIDRMVAINQVASMVSQSLDLDRTLQNALKVVTNVIGADGGGISMIDPKTGEVVLQAQLGWNQNFLNPPMRVPLGVGMSGWVIEKDRVLVANDLSEPGDIPIAIKSFTDEAFGSIVMAPMHARSKIIGIISMMSKQKDSFSEPIVDLLRAIADTVGIALDNARLYQQSVENESRLSAVLQATTDGIITTDQGGIIRTVNPSAERLLSVRAQETCKRPLHEAPIPKTLSEPLRAALSSREKSPEKSFQVNMEDGRVLLVFASPVAEENSTLSDNVYDGWVIVLQDVTHLREAEEARAQFIQAAAHDMRNPLGVTMTSLGTLQSITEDAIAQEVIGVALSGVNRMQRLLDDLLHLERIENGYAFTIDDVDITELIYECLAQVRPLLREKSQTYSVDIEPGLGIVQADAHWIGRSLTNYLSNANKYSPKRSHIILKAFEQQGFIHIEVTDNGPGIPLDVQSRLFERFYRAKDANTEKGSGLGLAIVKSALEAHNGSVYMRSKVGDGSTFGFTLPKEASF